MDKSSFIRTGIVFAVFYVGMIARYVYSGYVKAPREIKRLLESNRNSEAEQWQKYMDKCRTNTVLFSAVGLFCLVIFFSAI